jgi:hypothetical protein
MIERTIFEPIWIINNPDANLIEGKPEQKKSTLKKNINFKKAKEKQSTPRQNF